MAKHPVLFGQVDDPRACGVQQDGQRVTSWLCTVLSPITRSAFVSRPCPILLVISCVSRDSGSQQVGHSYSTLTTHVPCPCDESTPGKTHIPLVTSSTLPPVAPLPLHLSPTFSPRVPRGRGHIIAAMSFPAGRGVWETLGIGRLEFRSCLN